MQLQEVLLANDIFEDAALPTAPKTLLSKLDSLGIEYTLYKHQAVFTNEQAASLRGNVGGLETTNLFLRDKKGRMCLLSKAEKSKVDLKALDIALGYNRFSFGSAERLMENLGVKPGSVTAFSVINDTENKVEMFLDAAILKADLVGFHPLLNTLTVTLKPSDVVRFLESVNHAPKIVDLSLQPYALG